MLRPSVNFGFAFNDAEFSDRVLHMEIMADSLDSNRKRKRERLDNENDSEGSAIVKVKTYHISSPILAGNSPFFHKLFKNGMKESQQRDATIAINESEEVAVMDLLNFMYSNSLKATTILDLLRVLIAADKFEVSDCMRYCIDQLLQTMSLESALLYVELPSSVLVSKVVQPLINAAKECIVTHYKDINKSQEEAMALPLSAVEVVLGSDLILQADSSGDDVFEFILKWARANYPELNERREILTKRMPKIIRFQHMTRSKLEEVLVCPDFDKEEVSKVMLESLISVHEVPYRQHIHASNNFLAIKVERYEPRQPRCIVYFDLKKGDCENLFPSGELSSQSFILSGRRFYLWAQCCTIEEEKLFGLRLIMEEGSESCTLDYEYAVIKKSSMEFQQAVEGKDKFSDLESGLLFGIPWIDFISKESDYFIGGILHLRVDLTINNAEA